MSVLKATEDVYPTLVAQIALLQCDKAPTKVPTKYTEYVFLSDLMTKLLNNTSVNKYGIKLINKKQPLYEPIYTFSLVKLETLKVYIKIYINIGFIRLSKSLASIPIFFDKKPDNNLRLCIEC